MFAMNVKGTNQFGREEDLGLLIVVGGPGRSGCSTISKLLAKHFNLERIYGGEIMRGYAKDMGMDLIEFFKYIESNDLGKYYDEKVDAQLIEFAKKKDVLIESKTFAALTKLHNIPRTVSIWLYSDINTRAMRTFLRNGEVVSESSEKFKAEVNRLTERYEIDGRRFLNSYDMDYSNPKLYNDIVIDSSRLNEEETFNLILNMLKDGGYIKSN